MQIDLHAAQREVNLHLVDTDNFAAFNFRQTELGADVRADVVEFEFVGAVSDQWQDEDFAFEIVLGFDVQQGDVDAKSPFLLW